MDTMNKRMVWTRRFTTASLRLEYPEIKATMLGMIRTTMQRDAWAECGVHVTFEDIEIVENTFIVDTIPDEDDDLETFVSEPIEVTEFIATAYTTGAPRA